MRQIAILGWPGSIGRNTLRVVAALKGEFAVAALGAGANVELLAEQIEQWRPRVASVSDGESAEKLSYELKRRGVTSRPEIHTGVEGLCEVATCDGAEMARGSGNGLQIAGSVRVEIDGSDVLLHCPEGFAHLCVMTFRPDEKDFR